MPSVSVTICMSIAAAWCAIIIGLTALSVYRQVSGPADLTYMNALAPPLAGMAAAAAILLVNVIVIRRSEKRLPAVLDPIAP